MKIFRLTPAAEDDLFDVWRHTAVRGLTAADKLEEELLHACQRVANRPDLGHWRHDLTDKPVQFLSIRSRYLIVYDPAVEPLSIIRILHGARDIANELRE